MEGLPPVALDTILGYLDEVSLSSVGATSFHLYAATNSDRLWRRHCVRRGWSQCCPGGPEDLALKRSLDVSNVSGTSPTFRLGDLVRGDDCSSEVALPAMCLWKLAYFRAAHLKANWQLGRYTVALMRGHLQKTAHLTDTACNGQLVVSAASDGSACAWNLVPSKNFPEPFSLIRRIEIAGSVSAVALSPHCLFLACGDGSLRAFALTDFSLVKVTHLLDSIRMLRVSNDGCLLVSICEHASHSGFAAIYLIDVASFQVITVFNAHNDDITSAQLDGNLLATASWDQSVALWSLNPPGNVLRSDLAHTDGVLALKFSRGSARAVSGGADGFVTAWALTGDGLESNFGLERLWSAGGDAACEVYCVDFNCEVVASGGSDSAVHVWDWGGALMHSLLGHHGNVRHLVLGPEGRVVSAGDVKMLFVWDYRHGAKLAFLNRNPSVIRSLWMSQTQLVVSSAGSPAEVVVLSFW